MQEKLDRIQCDECEKEATAKDEIYVGGHPFTNWFSVWKRGTRTFDFCSLECLRNFDFDKKGE